MPNILIDKIRKAEEMAESVTVNDDASNILTQYGIVLEENNAHNTFTQIISLCSN